MVNDLEPGLDTGDVLAYDARQFVDHAESGPRAAHPRPKTGEEARDTLTLLGVCGPGPSGLADLVEKRADPIVGVDPGPRLDVDDVRERLGNGLVPYPGKGLNGQALD